MRSRRPPGIAGASTCQQYTAMFSAVGMSVGKVGNVEIQVLVVQVDQQLLLDQVFQYVNVDHVAGVGIDRALDGHVHLVVVAMVVRIGAHAENPLVPLLGTGGIVQAMRRIEVHSPRHTADSACRTVSLGDQVAGRWPGRRWRQACRRQRCGQKGTGCWPVPRGMRGRRRRGLLKPDEEVWRPHQNVCLPPRGVTSVPVSGPFTGPVGSITLFLDAASILEDRTALIDRQRDDRRSACCFRSARWPRSPGSS